MIYFQIGSSPLSARASFPIGIYILGVVLVAVLVGGIWFLTKHLMDYRKSDKYIQKQLSRVTTLKDVKKFIADNRLSQPEEDMLWYMCRTQKLPNINYYIKNPEPLFEKFNDFYNYLKQNGASQEDINTFFILNFNVEKISAATKNLLSTKQLVPESVVFYLTHESEQCPFYVKNNTQDFLALEIPKFMYDNEKLRPPLLERLRFITKAQNGMTYHFTSRAMRYQTNPDGKVYIIIAHSEDLLNQAHRNSKRESIDAECIFSPARLARPEETSKKAQKNNDEEYIIAQKEYPGKVTNISSGGCCIKTSLPIKEKQYLTIRIPSMNLDEHIIGIIRKTRQLQDTSFNLHIQFLRIDLESKNRINAYAFKYEI